MIIRKHLAVMLVALSMLGAENSAAEAWQAEEGDRLQERAEKAIQNVREKVERSHPYFEDAYAMAVWPGINRVAFGFGGGALMPVYAAFIGRLFGAQSFGTVMGLGGLVMLPFGAAAPILAGVLRDASGDYTLALGLFVAAFLAGAALILAVRPRTAAAH